MQALESSASKLSRRWQLLCVCVPAEQELGWRAGQRAGRWTSSAVLLTAANEPTPVKARSAERVDERRDATWSCRSTLTLSSGPGSRTDIFGLLDDPGTLTNTCVTSIYVADCKGMAGLLPGIARLAQPRDARAPSLWRGDWVWPLRYKPLSF